MKTGMNVRELAFAAGLGLFAGVAVGQPLDFSSAGSDTDVTNTLNAYRTALGALNGNVPGSFVGGRREVNWDGVPDASSSPNAFPGDFFNGTTPGRARGIVFSTPGTGLEVSADNSNPTGTPPEFANIDASYAGTFRPFSPQRLFTAIGSNVTEVRFTIPGSNADASVRGFGVVFNDVDLPDVTRIEYYNRLGSLLHTIHAPASAAGQEGHSFAGTVFQGGERVWSVRIVTGTHALGAGVIDNPGGGVDVVAMDDFIYAEPVGAGNPELFQSGGTDLEVQTAVDTFRAALGALNANTPGSFGTGRREINWDGVPDASSSPTAFPADFFNGATPGRARGVVFSTEGAGFEVSADNDNPTATPVEFANIDPSYAGLFRVFSPQRLFTAIGNNATRIDFFVAGSAQRALVTGFGSVFTDVDLATSTRIDYFDAGGGLLASQLVPPSAAGSEGLSFAGAHFGETPRVGSVVIRSGSAALGAGVLENIAEGVDLAVMDDFLYGEPNLLLCPGDFNESGAVNSDDFFAFLDAFFAEDESADVNDDGVVSSDDFYTFLTDYFSACP